MVKNTEILAKSFLEAYDKSLPDPETLQKLQSQAVCFEKLAQLYTNQIRSRVMSEMELLQSDYKRFNEDFVALKQAILTSLENAIQTKVQALADDYLDRDKWVEFDNTQAQLIVKHHLEPFYSRWNETFNLWNRNIQRFAEKLEENIKALDQVVMSSCNTEEYEQRVRNNFTTILARRSDINGINTTNVDFVYPS